MSSKRIVIEYYDNLVNDIDIIAEKALNKDSKGIKKDEINTTRSMFLDKIKEIRELNLNFLESNKIVNEKQPEKVFKPKVCYPIRQSGVDLGKLIIARNLPKKTVIDLLNYRTEEDGPTRDYEEVAIYKSVFRQYQDELIIDLSSHEKFKLERLIIEFETNEFYDIDEYDFIEITRMIDGKSLIELNLTAECHFYFNDDIFKEFINLKTLDLCLLYPSTCTLKCFKSLTNLEELSIHCIDEYKQTLYQEVLGPLIKLKNFKFNGKIRPFETKYLLNIENLKFYSQAEIDFKTSPVENTKAIKTITCEDSSIKFISQDYFKGFKCLLYLNLIGSSVFNLSAECLNYLENLEYLNLLTERANTEIVFSDLKLSRLKYLAIACEQIPEFKNLQLKYLKMKGLTQLDSSKLSNQRELIGMGLIVHKNVYDNLTFNDFMNLKSLVHLEFKSIDEISRDKLDTNKCLEFLKLEQASLTQHGYFENAFMFSIYKSYEEIAEYVDFSDEVLNFIRERFEQGFSYEQEL